jgi:hypothetical protein
VCALEGMLAHAAKVHGPQGDRVQRARPKAPPPPPPPHPTPALFCLRARVDFAVFGAASPLVDAMLLSGLLVEVGADDGDGQRQHDQTAVGVEVGGT